MKKIASLFLCAILGSAHAEHQDYLDVVAVTLGQNNDILWAPISFVKNTTSTPSKQVVRVNFYPKSETVSISATGVYGNNFNCDLKRSKNPYLYDHSLNALLSLGIDSLLEIESHNANEECFRIKVHKFSDFQD